MNNKERKCVITNKVKDVTELLRIVRLANGQFIIDSQAPGRGAYISRDQIDVEKLKKSGALNRAFKSQIPDQLYQDLKQHLKERKDER